MIFIALARVWRKKIIFHCHSGKFDQFYFKGRDWQRFLIRWVLSLSDRIVALSPRWTLFFSDILPKAKLAVLENAVPLDHFTSVKSRFPKASEPMVLFAGLLTENKGLFDLLAVLPDLVEKVPSTRVLLAGAGDFKKIRSILHDQGLEKAVDLLGWVDPEELIGWYHQAHLLVLPSYYEGLPMVLLEAMACGLPIVSTRVGGIPELITEGENGILIDPGDRSALLEALAVLLTDPLRQAEMGEKNRNKIKEQYDIPIYVHKLKNLYLEILGEKR